MKVFDSELKVLEVLWERGDTSAKDLAAILNEQVDWSKTTTYTVIKKCTDKGLISRKEPNFICSAQITKNEVRETETTDLINRVYDGMADELVASILGRKKLSNTEIEKLKKLINELE